MMNHWLQGAMRRSVACSPFSSPQGVPMDNAIARVVWLPAKAPGVTRRFDKLPEGRCATFFVQANAAERAIGIEVAR